MKLTNKLVLSQRRLYVVVPRIAAGDHLPFIRMDAQARSLARGARAARPAGEIARFSLKKSAGGDSKGGKQ